MALSKKKKNPKANLKTAMPQSLRARATALKPQANRRRSDQSNLDHHRRRSLLALIGDRSSRCRLVTAQRPQPSGLPAWLL